jgi:hypothetical protein
MHPQKIDLTSPAQVVKEIFDDDHWIKDEFSKRLSSEIMQFSEALSESFKRFPQLDRLSSGGNEQVAFVTGFIFGVFDDLLVSMKLLVAGKMIASGNIMRQAIEGMAVALLCASSEFVSVMNKKCLVKVNYWQRVKAQDRLVYAHKSIGQLQLNCDLLGVSHDAVRQLKLSRDHYHSHSHPGLIGMAYRMGMGELDESGPLFVGGYFDLAKLSVYRKEIAGRTSLCLILPNMIDGLIARLTSNAKENS